MSSWFVRLVARENSRECGTGWKPVLHSSLAPLVLLLTVATAHALDWVRISEDGKSFVRGDKNEPFIVWGVNYDHDEKGRLIEDYWFDEWKKVDSDLREIKQLGANTVRIHL